MPPFSENVSLVLHAVHVGLVRPVRLSVVLLPPAQSAMVVGLESVDKMILSGYCRLRAPLGWTVGVREKGAGDGLGRRR